MIITMGNIPQKIKVLVKCNSPNHYPPVFSFLDPGDYEYVCPDCTEVINFYIPQPKLRELTENGVKKQ